MNVWIMLGRFLAGCAISALAAVGGMWFILDRSLQGVISSIDSTNQGMNRLNDSVLASDQRLEGRFASLELRIDNLIMKVGEGFTETQNKIEKKAELTIDDFKSELADLAKNQKEVAEAVEKIRYANLPPSVSGGYSFDNELFSSFEWSVAASYGLQASDRLLISPGVTWMDPFVGISTPSLISGYYTPVFENTNNYLAEGTYISPFGPSIQ